jgi:DNA polymerase-3 subunit alpha
VPNSFLHLKISGRKNYYNDDVRLQFNEIQMLQDILDKMSKKVTIELDLNEINAAKLDLITTILDTHKGDKSIHFTVTENEEKIKINLPSRTKKVAISNEFLSTLKKEDLSFKLN